MLIVLNRRTNLQKFGFKFSHLKLIVHSRSIERSVGQKHLINIIERNSHICAARYFPLMNLSTNELVKKDLWRFSTWDLELSQ